MEELVRATALAEGRHFWFRGFRAFVTPLVDRALRGRNKAQILDCGCGTGANVALLAPFGRVYGFDLSEIGPRIARQAGRSVARASVTAVPFPSDSFDLVTSFDVLYSLEPPDERAAVAEMFRLLKPGGYAIVNVAALEFLKGDHSVLSRELRRYTKASLGSLLQKGGFTIVRLTYTNATLLPLLAVLRAIQRARGLASESDAQREISVPSAAVNGLLSGVLWLESLWLRRFNEPLGSSLLCLAQKPITAQDEPRT